MATMTADTPKPRVAPLNRRYDDFMRHFRAGNLAAAPAGGMARRIRKWRP